MSASEWCWRLVGVQHIMDMDMDMDMVCSNDKSAAFEAATASLKFTCGAVTLGYR